MKRIVVGLVAVSTLAAAGAFAADLPYRYGAPVAPFVAPPLFTWTGFYVGANAGYGVGKYSGTGRSLFGTADGGSVGATVGYNFQSGRLVIGVEGDLDYADVSAKQHAAVAPIVAKSRMDAYGTIRGRVGYTFDRLLVYGTGGYAGGNIDSTLGDGLRNRVFTDSQYHNGFALGGGVEYAFSPRWSAKAEYLYTSFEDSPTFTQPDQRTVGLGMSTVRAGINYHF